MSLKTRLRVAIVTLVALVVVALSTLYLLDFTRAAFSNASDRARFVADDVKGFVLERLEEQLRQRPQPPASLDEYKQAWTEIVRADPAIAAMLQRSRANAYMVVNVTIAAQDGRILAAADPSTIGTRTPPLSSIDVMVSRGELSEFRDLFNLSRNYAILLPLGVRGEETPIFTIAVLVQPLFLRHSLEPAFLSLGLAFIGSLLASLLLAYALPSLILRPLERIGRQIDLIRAGKITGSEPPVHESREFADVRSKLDLLGQQYRGEREDAHALRANVDKLVRRLEDAVLLFDGKHRLVVAGRPAEQLLGREAKDILGLTLDEVFPAATFLGETIRESISTHNPIDERLVLLEGLGDVTFPSGRILVSVEPVEETGGILVRLRDAESRRQLERHLDVSSRLAAISRLTGGVAHEIKNPLNAMSLHLEVLKSKLNSSEPEIDVISNEIQRLDRVVKTFLDFNRPVDLQIRELDLAQLAADIASFLSPQAGLKNVAIETDLSEPLLIRGDPGLLRQAVLNVMVNGVEALQTGGHLRLRSGRIMGDCTLFISDDGPGIPMHVQQNIFNLYFTTKTKGSGIGLAMTSRLVQLHGGTIEVFSEPGLGATFRLRFPAAAARN